jgi:hypothetical protein
VAAAAATCSASPHTAAAETTAQYPIPSCRRGRWIRQQVATLLSVHTTVEAHEQQTGGTTGMSRESAVWRRDAYVCRRRYLPLCHARSSYFVNFDINASIASWVGCVGDWRRLACSAHAGTKPKRMGKEISNMCAHTNGFGGMEFILAVRMHTRMPCVWRSNFLCPAFFSVLVFFCVRPHAHGRDGMRARAHTNGRERPCDGAWDGRRRRGTDAAAELEGTGGPRRIWPAPSKPHSSGLQCTRRVSRTRMQRVRREEG